MPSLPAMRGHDEGVWALVVAAIASMLSHKWVWWVLLVIVVFVVVDGLYSIMAFGKRLASRRKG